MLSPPHNRYDRLHVYYLDRRDIVVPAHPDLIGTWIEDEQAILFFHSCQDGLIEKLCRRERASIIYQADLDYQDWEAGVAITSFASRYIQVVPVWEQAVDQDDRATIVLDPSVIFGSGFHATTRLCLETLEVLLVESGTTIHSVLDLGTGTGLLAIAAAMLGAKQVEAVDNNPLAVAVANKNIRLNACPDRVLARECDLLAGLPDMRRDLVILNLYKGLLEQLFARPDFWQAGYYLVSGFLPGMEADLLAALPPGMHMVDRRGREQWRLWLLANGNHGRS
jgi:ribosomal protein L11 methyltransferase